MNNQFYTLKIQCADQKGIIARITQLIAQNNGNILDLTQHTATDINRFFLKSVFEFNGPVEGNVFAEELENIAHELNLEFEIFSSHIQNKVAIFVSKTNHCLYELLLAHQDGELNCEIPCIISNHPDLENISQEFNIPFYVVSSLLTKTEQEEKIGSILQKYGINTLVLARYMQILRKEFTDLWPNKIINIHHGFLPAFKGAKPYHQAWNKGVKLIGATAHFANEDLDQGPIIAQDVQKVDDHASISEFIRMGKNIERNVLLKAMQLYLNHSVFVYNGRTFILN